MENAVKDELILHSFQPSCPLVTILQPAVCVVFRYSLALQMLRMPSIHFLFVSYLTQSCIFDLSIVVQLPLPRK